MVTERPARVGSLTGVGSVGDVPGGCEEFEGANRTVD